MLDKSLSFYSENVQFYVLDNCCGYLIYLSRIISNQFYNNINENSNNYDNNDNTDTDTNNCNNDNNTENVNDKSQ